jgi:ArsR family transcriptional regulator, lead/cadmium/zinc/bismuth-responsive transcriptional repressor
VSDDRCELLCLDLPKAEALRDQLPAVQALEEVATRMKAIADPTRLLIAAALQATDELCVCDLSWVTGRRETLVSHHLRTLRAAGLAASRRDGKMVMYRLTDTGRALLAAAHAEVAA